MRILSNPNRSVVIGLALTTGLAMLGTATAQPAKTKTPLPALSALEVKAAALKKLSPTPLVSKQVKAAKMGVKEVDLGTPFSLSPRTAYDAARGWIQSFGVGFVPRENLFLFTQSTSTQWVSLSIKTSPNKGYFVECDLRSNSSTAVDVIMRTTSGANAVQVTTALPVMSSQRGFLAFTATGTTTGIAIQPSKGDEWAVGQCDITPQK